MINASKEFNALRDYWRARHDKHQHGAVGRIGEDVDQQGTRIELAFKRFMKDGEYFPHGLDFGCGWGRQVSLLARYCGHLWLADLFPDVTRKAANVMLTTSPVAVGYPMRLPLPDNYLDFVWDGMTLQGLQNGVLFDQAVEELNRLLKSGGTFMSLHVTRKPKPHVVGRTPEQLAKLFKLKDVQSRVVCVDKADEKYWMLRGVRA